MSRLMMFYRLPSTIPICITFLCLNLIIHSAKGEENAITDEQLRFFESKIRPVLVERCYQCHAADAKILRGGLFVDSREGLLKGGDSGPAIDLEEPENGTLLDALRYETFEMPPKQKLPDHVIADFEKWIAMGSPDPRVGGQAPLVEEGIDLEQGRQFWSFRSLQPSSVQQKHAKLSATIDQVLTQSRKEQELETVPAADDLTLLRRLYYDLIGLPPTAEQIREYVSDSSPDRYLKLVEELLASPQFGEHWGRHWLDLARYSSSTGGGRSLLYKEAWRYRNYVLDSFNADKPFDEFIVEQIAGDLLSSDDYQKRREQLIATGFLALGPHNYENQDKEQLRMDVIDEQIETVGRVFLGMTIGCARCHDHKFDPIPTSDYYALAGIFRSTNSLVDGNVSRWVSTPLPLAPQEQQALADHQALVKQLQGELKQLEKELSELKLQLPHIIKDNNEADLTGTWTESTSIPGYLGRNYQHSSDTAAQAAYLFEIEPGRYEVQLSYTPAGNRTKQAEIKLQHHQQEKTFQINQQLTPAVDGQFHSLGEFEFTGEVTVVISPTESAPTIIDAVKLISFREEDSERLQAAREQIKVAETAIRSKEEKLKESLENAPATPPSVVSVEDHEEIEDYHICIRGDAHRLGEEVPRGFMSVVNQIEAPEFSNASSGRLELAEWIAHPENPLTARVYVNRIWKHLFGTGIVRTVDNFGQPGETPSHPELLDELTREFIEHGWSTKELIKQIVSSKTYQLSSEPAEKAESLDPDNRYLSHQNRKRLTAEAIHDSLLYIAGKLDLTPGQDTIRPGTKSEYGYQFDFGKRAVYLPVFRNRLPDLFAVFDFPNPNMPQGKRTASNISPQALFLLNSDFAFTHAQATAERAMQESDQTEERIEWQTLSILGRYPTSDEQRLFTEFIDGEVDSISKWTQVAQSLFGSLDFRYLR